MSEKEVGGLDGKDAHRYARRVLGFWIYWRSRIEDATTTLRRMPERLWWRVQFTRYGQRKTELGWRLWWEWSATAVDEWDDAKCGLADYRDAVKEEIYAAMADAEYADA